MSLLDRERTVAPAGFNRWLVPTSALSIHLAIGQAYGFSVFNLPMTRLVGLTAPAPDDWKLTSLGWIFSLAIVFLGLAAAFGGTWVERAGPRKAMLASAICFSGGFLVSASSCTRCGWSTWATACWAASAWGWATSRR
jgi:MFS family permease